MAYSYGLCSYALYSYGLCRYGSMADAAWQVWHDLLCSYGLYSHGLYNYGLCSYGICSYGLYSHGLYSYGLGRYGSMAGAARVRRDLLHSYGLHNYGSYSYGLCGYSLYSYGLYSYGLYSHGLYVVMARWQVPLGESGAICAPISIGDDSLKRLALGMFLLSFTGMVYSYGPCSYGAGGASPLSPAAVRSVLARVTAVHA